MFPHRLLTMKVLSECAFGGLHILGIEAIAHMDSLPLLGGVGLNDPKLFQKRQVSPNCSIVDRQRPSYVSRSHSTSTNRQVTENFRPKWRHAENRRHVGSSERRSMCWVSIICHSAILPKNQETSVFVCHILIQRVCSNDTLCVGYRQTSTPKEFSGEL